MTHLLGWHAWLPPLAALWSFMAVGQESSPLPADEVLARVGGKVITTREFVQRIELMPWSGKEKTGIRDSIKVRALQSLVAEKLFALEAEEQGIGNDERTRAMVGALERALARDQLYKEEIVKKVRVPEAEIQEGLRRYGWQFRVLGYAFPDERQAQRFFRACADTARLEKTIASLLRPGTKVTDTLAVSYGDMDRPYENAIYARQRPGITPPVFSQKLGWAVFRILDRQANPARLKQSIPDIRLTVEKKARKRLEDLRAQHYLKEFGQGRTLHLDSALFAVLADTVIRYLRADTAARRLGIVSHVDRLLHVFAPRLREVLATSPARKWTLEEILESLRFFPLQMPEVPSRRTLTYALNRLIILAIQGETFSAEGMKRQLNRTEEVRGDLEAWQDAWRATANARRVERSLFGEELSELSPGARNAEAQKRLTALREHLRGLARRYGVELFEEKLARIPISSFSMVTRRSIGFGGSMIAVPIIAPEWEWITGGADQRTLAP